MDDELSKAIRTNPSIETFIDLLEIFFKIKFPKSIIITTTKDEIYLESTSNTIKIYKIEESVLDAYVLDSDGNITELLYQRQSIDHATKQLYTQIIESIYGSGTQPSNL